MADLEFFLDPICPWCWITSRWVTEVQQRRDYDVMWRFISLMMINENRTSDWYTPRYRAGHVAGHAGLRVAAALRSAEGNDAVARYYTELGNRLHGGGRNDGFRDEPATVIAESLLAAGLPPKLAGEATNDAHDALIRSETELGFERAGDDVGTPILTFKPGGPAEGSFFGPVISSIPRGAEAERLWDAVELIATTTGVAELKRSNRQPPDFT